VAVDEPATPQGRRGNEPPPGPGSEPLADGPKPPVESAEPPTGSGNEAPRESRDDTARGNEAPRGSRDDTVGGSRDDAVGRGNGDGVGGWRRGDGGVGGQYGRPGPPLNWRSPFLVGLMGGLGVIVAYAIFLGVRNAASILVLIFVALFLAIGLNPAIIRLRSWGLPRWAAVTIMALTVVLLLCGGVTALIPPLVTQTGQLIENVPRFIEELQRNETVSEIIERFQVLDKVQGAINAGTVTNALGGVVGAAGLLFGTIFNVLTVMVLTIYFMAAFDRMKSAAYALVPASRRRRVQLLTDEILTKVGAYMVGALAIAVLAGASTWVLAMAVGLAYPFALAVVIAVCDLIPQIGATLGAVIVSLIGLADSWVTGLICAVFFIVYQQIENYVIYPRVMQRSVKVSEVAAVTAALLGVGLFGVLGALIAIPMVAAVQLIVREVINPSMDAK
jgi:predicted PurR-regulated permease PerM